MPLGVLDVEGLGGVVRLALPETLSEVERGRRGKWMSTAQHGRDRLRPRHVVLGRGHLSRREKREGCDERKFTKLFWRIRLLLRLGGLGVHF